MKNRLMPVHRMVMLLLSCTVLAVLAVPASSQAASTPSEYYVSLGDSASVGYQPSPPGATSGYTGYVAKKLKMQLENFGCGGATTTSILNVVGCTSPYGPVAATDAVAYPTQTQVTAADTFIKAHSGQIGLITVWIGGNDLNACDTASDPVSCVEAAVATMQTNITTLAGDLRTAAGSSVPIIGLTFPDVTLGLWVYPTYPASSADQAAAEQSAVGFQSLINPAIKAAYATASGRFVDVTAATGAYTPLTKLTSLSPYGQIPTAVADVCKLTWYCKLGDGHPNTTGYTEIGKLIAAAFKK